MARRKKADIDVVWTPVTSNCISAVRYEGSTLYVQFQHGEEYEYNGVPEKVYKAFLEAESKGHFFGANLRYSYPYQRRK